MKKLDIKKLTQADIGRWVVYKPELENERGKIKGFSDTVVWVVYHANNNWDSDHWKDYTGQSTRPEDLYFD